MGLDGSSVSALFRAVRDTARRIQARRRDAVERKRGYKRALLDRVAERLGIQRIEASDEIGDSLAGWVDGFYVEIHAGPFASRRRAIERVRIEVDSQGAMPPSITIGPKLLYDPEFGREMPAPRRPKSMRPGPESQEAGEVKLPDLILTETIHISGDAGDAPAVHAIMDDRTRREILATVGEYGVWIAGGTMVWEGGRAAANAEPIIEMASRMLNLVRRLAIAPRKIPERLAAIVHGDPSPEMRLQCLLLLIVHYPSAEETLGACRFAMNMDANPVVRIRAANHLGEEGLETLKSIVHAEYGNDDARVMALQNIARNHPRVAPEVLAKLLWSTSSRVIYATLEGLAHLDVRRVQASEVEERLIVLAASSDRAFKIKAIDLLARVGTAVALAALHGLSKGMLQDAAVKEAARSAVAQIESRLGEAEGGRLSIVDTDSSTGAVSVAADPGSVSLTEL